MGRPSLKIGYCFEEAHPPAAPYHLCPQPLAIEPMLAVRFGLRPEPIGTLRSPLEVISWWSPAPGTAEASLRGKLAVSEGHPPPRALLRGHRIAVATLEASHQDPHLSGLTPAKHYLTWH